MTPELLRTVFPKQAPRQIAQMQRAFFEPALLCLHFYASYTTAVFEAFTGKTNAKKGA